ncbi:MAG TPA: hypoxanthine phosphoribosyltransferase [Candidatus Kapabacteria bacterium]|nr:hypoxanthine phosphoribosyltransferase [Candidatus Kapabacteria bacterium]
MSASAEPREGLMIGGHRFVPMIDAAAIAAAVRRIGSEIRALFRNTDPLVVCVLNGAALFHADLIRAIGGELEVDYLRVGSYDGGMASTGRINFTAAPGTSPRDRNVILVEDIVDTGRTADHLRRYYQQEGAASVAVAALLYKREADLLGHPPEFLGFEIPDRFVVGYGLDYRQQGRNLPAVYVLEAGGAA